MIYIGKFFKGLWSAINFSRKLILNLIFFGLLAVIVLSIPQQNGAINVPEGAVLKLNFEGKLVEELTTLTLSMLHSESFFLVMTSPRKC